MTGGGKASPAGESPPAGDSSNLPVSSDRDFDSAPTLGLDLPSNATELGPLATFRLADSRLDAGANSRW